MMNKSIGASIALIAYSSMMEGTNGLRVNQADAASGDHLEPYAGGLAQVSQKSLNSNTAVPVEFDNETSQTIELFWLNFQGNPISYGTIAPGQSMHMGTYATHPWIAKGLDNTGAPLEVDGDKVFVPEAGDSGRIIHIDEADFYQSLTWSQPVHVTFKNESSQQVELFWHNYQGAEVSYGKIAAGGTKAMNTYATHPWSAEGVADAGVYMSVDSHGVYVPVAGDANRTIVIEEYESKTWDQFINLTFDNESGQDVELFWHNYNGDEVSYGTIGNGQTRVQGTFATHPWSVTGKADASKHLILDGDDVFVPEASDNNRTIYIGQID